MTLIQSNVFIPSAIHLVIFLSLAAVRAYGNVSVNLCKPHSHLSKLPDELEVLDLSQDFGYKRP